MSVPPIDRLRGSRCFWSQWAGWLQQPRRNRTFGTAGATVVSQPNPGRWWFHGSSDRSFHIGRTRRAVITSCNSPPPTSSSGSTAPAFPVTGGRPRHHNMLGGSRSFLANAG